MGNSAGLNYDSKETERRETRMATSHGIDVSAYQGTQVGERFWAKVQPTGFCWDWTASIKPNGYGQFSVTTQPKQRVAYAHRFAYELLVGPIPEGMELDHLCRNRMCVNPDHLEPVDRRTNLLRSPITFSGLAVRQDTCGRGHPWVPENVRLESGRRICRTCRNARKRALYGTERAA